MGHKVIDSGPQTEPLAEQWQKSGDWEESFRRLFETYRRPVGWFFKERGFSNEECSDLTQETFLRVFRGMASFRQDASFKTWLYKIARNVWIKALKRGGAQKRAGHVLSLDQIGTTVDKSAEPNSAAQELASNEQGPLDAVLVAEQNKRLRKALQHLPPQQQRLLMLRIYQDLKYREIADILQLSVGAVKSQINSAKNSLQEKLNPAPPNPPSVSREVS